MTETSPCSFQNFLNDSEEQVQSTMGFIQDHVEVSMIFKNVIKHMIQTRDSEGSIINN